MKITLWITVAVALLLTGFAAGFPVGKDRGFNEGSEWAFIQADILAREAGVFMPVIYEDGQFRVIIKQPRDLYKKAWRLADRYDEEQQNVKKHEYPLVSHTPSIQQVQGFIKNPDESSEGMVSFELGSWNGVAKPDQQGKGYAPGIPIDVQGADAEMNVEM